MPGILWKSTIQNNSPGALYFLGSLAEVNIFCAWMPSSLGVRHHWKGESCKLFNKLIAKNFRKNHLNPVFFWCGVDSIHRTLGYLAVKKTHFEEERRGAGAKWGLHDHWQSHTYLVQVSANQNFVQVNRLRLHDSPFEFTSRSVTHLDIMRPFKLGYAYSLNWDNLIVCPHIYIRLFDFHLTNQ